MAIALGTALAVGAIASAAGGAVKAKMQSNAANKAAEQQQQGTKQASGYMNQAQQNLNSLWSPYINQGNSAMGTLSRLTTPGAGARYASPGPPNMMPQGTPRQMQPMQSPMQGPYMMAEGGDMVVDRPTMFIAGEAGPERATFSGGGRPQGGPPQGGPQQMGGPFMRRMPGEAPNGGAQIPSLAGAVNNTNRIRQQLLQKYGGGGPPQGGPPPGQARPMPNGGFMGPFQQQMGGPPQGMPPQGPPPGMPPQGPPQGPPPPMPGPMPPGA